MNIEIIKFELMRRINMLDLCVTQINLNDYPDPQQMLSAHTTKSRFAAQAEELRDLLAFIDTEIDTEEKSS